jgi:tetratricopeptide (TPR) repeat protein
VTGYLESVETKLREAELATVDAQARAEELSRRQKLVVQAGTAIAVSLLLGIGVSAWQAVRATRAQTLATRAETLAKDRLAQVAAERDAKDVARQNAEAISKFIIEIFESPDPTRDGRTITVAETLDKAAQKLESDLGTQPRRRAELQATLGSTYSALGLYREAIALHEKVREYHFNNSGPQDPDTLDAMHHLASSYYLAKRPLEAIPMEEELVAYYRERVGSDDPNTVSCMNNLANSYADVGRLEEAIQMQEEVLALRLKQLGPEQNYTLHAMNNLSTSYSKVGRHDDALRMREKLLSLRRKVNGAEHPDTLKAIANLAISYSDAGRHDEALQMKEEVLSLKRKVLGPEHPSTLIEMHNLAFTYSALGRQDEALQMREQVLPLIRKVNGLEHPDTLNAMNAVAWQLLISPDQALHDPVRALELSEQTTKLDPKNAFFIGTLGVAHYRAGDYAAAITALQEALSLHKEYLPVAGFFLAMARWQAGDKDQARKDYDQAVAWMEAKDAKVRFADADLLRTKAEAAALLLEPGAKADDQSTSDILSPKLDD